MIVVSGIQRTGTSLMMSVLEKNGFELLKDKMDFESDDFFENLQPEYNEHSIFSQQGITKDSIKGYEEILSNKKLCCKIMGDAFIKIDDIGLEYIDKIIIMVRSWKSQTASWNPVHIKNTERFIKSNKEAEKLVLSVGSIEDFISERLYEPGISYTNRYIKILNFIFKYKLQKKCIFIDFDDLMNNFGFVSRTLRKPLDIKLKNNNVIQKNISKFSQVDHKFNEFKPGFFEFLDKLELKLKCGVIDNNFIVEYEKWNEIINRYLVDKENFIKLKYGFTIKKI